MRKDFLLFLSFLVDAGYIVSFRVRGSFRFFERVKDGKAAAARMGRKYDHQKIF